MGEKICSYGIILDYKSLNNQYPMAELFKEYFQHWISVVDSLERLFLWNWKHWKFINAGCSKSKDTQSHLQ